MKERNKILTALLHCTEADESVDVTGLALTESVDSIDGLDIVSRVPGSVEDDAAIGADEVDAQ